MPCFVCGSPPPNTVDHIRTRGSGGDDSPTNVWPLCGDCHLEKGQMGVKTFAETYKLPLDVSGIYPKLNFEWNL